jgi:signal transduction histidine kinase
MAALGLVSLLVTSVLAVLTWNVSSSYMLEQRERSAVRQATVHARLVERVLERGSEPLTEVLAVLGSEIESAVLVIDEGRFISSGTSVDPNHLPVPLLTTVQRGQAADQRILLDGVPVLAVGLPMPTIPASYVEVFPLRELDRNLRLLSWVLAAGTVACGLAAVLLGRWAASRALRPLRGLTAAAAIAAGGDLSVRLPRTRDPDLRPLADAFNDTAEHLQRRVERDARFAGDVSHELRSPLTTMVNAMAVLQRRRDEVPDTARRAIDLLAADLHRFRRMVGDLLEISRLDQGQDQLAFETLDLAELVNHATVHLITDSRHAVLRIDAAPLVRADRRQLERVIVNLIENAERHGHGLIRLAVQRRNGHARIEVDDAGPGVPAADRERVFERFARAPTNREAADTGVGLGLALVAEHVRRHDGNTWVEARPGGGARFIVELPEAPP